MIMGFVLYYGDKKIKLVLKFIVELNIYYIVVVLVPYDCRNYYR